MLEHACDPEMLSLFHLEVLNSDFRRKSNQLFHFEILIGLSKRNSESYCILGANVFAESRRKSFQTLKLK